MLPQDKFVFEKIYMTMFLDRHGQYDGRPACEKLIQDCGLTYRKGKNYIDVLKATNRNFSTDKSISAWLENAAERIDKVLTIDWAQRYARR